MMAEKSSWGPGPWQNEPDLEHWDDAATGYGCMVARSPTGCWCGYVSIPKGHPLHGKDNMDIKGLSVHFGLTFSGKDARPGHAEKWTLGFDCGHCDDVSPALEAHMRAARKGSLEKSMLKMMPQLRHMSKSMQPTYKTLPWVKAEVADLAAQLRELA